MEECNCIIKQRNARKIYCFGGGNSFYEIYYCRKDIRCDYEYLEWVDIWSGIINKPPFNKKDCIFVDDLNKTFLISGVVRTTKDQYWYYVDEPNIIEDEISKESLKKAQQEKEEYIEARKLERDEEKKQQEYEALPWYTKLFMWIKNNSE
jgi:hypothetical protein